MRDDEVYRFTEIDGKYWLAENLRYREPVLDASMCDNDGCRYSWLEAVGSDSAYNVCPEGWRLPSRTDWGEYDPYDFSVKPSGNTGFWTSSDTTYVVQYGDGYAEGAWMIDLRDKDAGVWLKEKLNRYSVRCVKDK